MNASVSVRVLCDFAARRGDLDTRFTPAPTALEGMEGHALVRSRRGAQFEAEWPVQGHHEGLLVRGRVDGYARDQARVEEVKTYKGDLARQPPAHRALHWAQAKVYGHLLCEQAGHEAMTVALVYLNLKTGVETTFTEVMPRAELKAYFEGLCQSYLNWAEQEAQHRQARDDALTDLGFIHPSFRRGQRELATEVYRAAVAGQVLLAQAPTGIGKTVGTLFPLLKAAPKAGLDKVFYLAAKTSGRQMALDALTALRGKPADGTPAPGLPLRVVEMVARDKACEHPQAACHGASCPLAAGFYDRLNMARSAAAAVWQAQELDQATLRQVALDHQVCPYYLSQEMVKWSDVVVGDYNYFLDMSAMLYALTQLNGWRVGLLVDEAHNLVDRGRDMYTAELRLADLALARKQPLAKAAGPLKRQLAKLAKAWRDIDASCNEAHQVLEELPGDFLAALTLSVSALGEAMADDPLGLDGPLQTFFLDAVVFGRLLEVFGPHALVDVSQPGAVLCVRNVVPGPHLLPRWLGAHTATLFSATLQPPAYFQQMLGLPESARCADIPSPFEPGQLQVRQPRGISTKYTQREGAVPGIVAVMAGQYRDRPGNYLAFFSSYGYLTQVLEAFVAAHPEVPVWVQTRAMGEAAQKAFLARFTPDGQGIGFAVLGGAFAEGIDLPGDRLIGAFVATLGLPQVNPVNEEMRRRMDELFGAGYDYAYLYPGLQKVVQAAGRVIRTPTDRGVVVLLDERYAQARVKRLLPAWWPPTSI